jgi:NADH:ubiquinone oxidoreductase subunit E
MAESAPDLTALLTRATRLASNPTAAVVAMLRAVEAEQGEVSEVSLVAIAAHGKTPLAEVRRIAGRAGVRRTKVNAQHHLAVCLGATCSLRGSQALLREAEALLGVSAGQVTADGRVFLQEAACLGVCDFGPNVRLDDELVEGTSRRRLTKLVERVKPSKRRGWWPFG